MRKPTIQNQGFTLIELSIVLVIIGLIIGGVLVGQDLIKAAQARAQVTQIEKYNQAVNTFVTKCGYLPGDIPAAAVAAFGFGAVPVRAGTRAQGDGNGLIEGYGFAGSAVYNWVTSGETAWFWEDLSTNSNFIDQQFNTAAITGFSGSISAASTPPLSAIIPVAKITGLYLYVYPYNNVNYFGLSQVTFLDGNGAIYGNTGLTVAQAFNIDKKIDDGMPQSGNVTATYQDVSVANGTPTWAAGNGVNGPYGTTATPGSISTCYDNGSGSGPQQYSMEISNGSNANCALSFKMQGAAR